MQLIFTKEEPEAKDVAIYEVPVAPIDETLRYALELSQM
jgi:hypothetical protein